MQHEPSPDPVLSCPSVRPQVSLSGHPNKPCGILKFKETMLMLDAALDISSAFCFLPLPLVHSHHFASLSNWAPKELQDSQLESVGSPSLSPSPALLRLPRLHITRPQV